MTRSIRFLTLFVTAGLIASSLTATAAATEREQRRTRSAGTEQSGSVTPQAPVTPQAIVEADGFEVLGSVRQAAVMDATPGADVELRDAAGTLVADGTTDSLGGFLAREVDAGEGYVFVVDGTSSEAFEVLDDPLLHETPIPTMPSTTRSRHCR